MRLPLLSAMLLLAAVQLSANEATRCEGNKTNALKSTITKSTDLAVTNVEFTQLSHPDGGSGISITYDLASPAGAATVSVEVSDDNGATFDIVPTTITGAVGPDVAPGEGLQILWHVSQDLPNIAINQAVIRVTADDGTCNDCLYWSDNASWASLGIGKPANDHNVTIPAGVRMILDEDTAELAGLTIEGTLEFAREDLALTADWIMIHGELLIGSETQPFTHQATITLTDDNIANSVMGMGTRGIMVMGGELILHGESPDTIFTQITDHVGAGDTTLPVIEADGWVPGDQIILAPTGYYGEAETERLEIASIAYGAGDPTITTTLAVQDARWGRLQYPTATGMSLTPDDSIVLTPEMEGVPTVLDQRAGVAHLTRNIVIQAPDDAAWQNHGFGAHIMVMGNNSTAIFDGVEVRRGGQAGVLGRYPFHYHIQSYAAGLEIGDKPEQVLRNSVVNVSTNRGIVVHGTNGLTIENNVLFDVLGHAMFTEDAVERRNTFDGNIVMKVRNPTPANALMLHDLNSGGDIGSSAFWISNPDNVLTNNYACDTEAFGYWLAFPETPQGENHAVDIRPNRIPFGTFADNTSHTSRFEGLMLDTPEINWDLFPNHGGQTADLQYVPMNTYDGHNGTELTRFHLDRFTVWKSGLGGIWDRATLATNTEMVSADNTHRFFAGSGIDGIIQRSLVVGTSLNDSGGYKPGWGGDPVISAFATYHSTFDIIDNLVLNFPLVPGSRSGVFATDDYYTRAVEKGTTRNKRNLVFNSHPGYKLRAAFSGEFSYQEHASWYTLASALWDEDGQWGPPGNWFVYDTPFLTHGLTVTEVAPNAELSGGVSVPGPFYGFYEFVLHGEGPTPPQNMNFDDLMEINVRRLASDLSEVAVWNVGAGGTPGMFLEHMRDFAAHPDGIYELTFPGSPFGIDYPTDLRLTFENMRESTDTVVVGIHYDGTLDPAVYLRYPDNSVVTPYTELGSLQDVLDSPGATYWQDSAANLVWVKLQGGTWQPPTTEPEFAFFDENGLYHTSFLHIRVP